MHLLLYFYGAAGNQRLRTTLSLFASGTALAWIPIILGALLGGTARTLLWAAAFLITAAGAFVASVASGWQLRSPSNFAERHDLVVIIVLGESLISVGAGAGPAITRAPVLVAAVLAFATTTCLWWLYFDQVARAAGRALARQPDMRRNGLATNAYSLGLFPLVAGVIYTALGIEQVLAHLSHDQTGRLADPLQAWTPTIALYGGTALYLTGRILFFRIAVGSTSPAQIVATGVTLALLPGARNLPALAALGLLTAVLVALVGYERFTGAGPATAIS